MKRMLLCGILMLVLLSTLIIPLNTGYAAGTVNAWYSDADIVGYAKYKTGGAYAVSSKSSDTNFTQTFFNVVTYAGARWNSVLPVSIGETSANYAINYIYGGTYIQMKEIVPGLQASDYGITLMNVEAGKSIRYGNTTKWAHPIIGTKVCIVHKPGHSLQAYQHTAVHEMGHMLGWHGHSSTKSDVMYAYPQITPITALTDRDKTHLTQIYSLFY